MYTDCTHRNAYCRCLGPDIEEALLLQLFFRSKPSHGDLNENVKRDFDEVLHNVGGFGRAQIFLFAAMCYGSSARATLEIAQVFIGKTPKFNCEGFGEDQNPCQVNCDRYIFDTSNFTSIASEVGDLSLYVWRVVKCVHWVWALVCGVRIVCVMVMVCRGVGFGVCVKRIYLPKSDMTNRSFSPNPIILSHHYCDFTLHFTRALPLFKRLS